MYSASALKHFDCPKNLPKRENVFGQLTSHFMIPDQGIFMRQWPNYDLKKSAHLFCTTRDRDKVFVPFEFSCLSHVTPLAGKFTEHGEWVHAHRRENWQNPASGRQVELCHDSPLAGLFLTREERILRVPWPAEPIYGRFFDMSAICFIR